MNKSYHVLKNNYICRNNLNDKTMKIEKLIRVFEKLLPIYEKAYKNKVSKEEVWKLDLCNGLCWAAQHHDLDRIDEVFYQYGYYQFYATTGAGFISPTPNKWIELKPRIDFMKSEIKSLKRLQKKGYTHV